jgi:hypothetical protein
VTILKAQASLQRAAEKHQQEFKRMSFHHSTCIVGLIIKDTTLQLKLMETLSLKK